MTPADSPHVAADNIWTQLLAGASRVEEKIPKKYLVICGEPHRGKKTLLERFIANSNSSLAAFPYPSPSHQPNVPSTRANTRNGKAPSSASIGPSFLARNHAAYTANGGSSMMLSGIADGTTTNQSKGHVRASSNSTRKRDAIAKATDSSRETGESLSATGQPLQLDVLEDPRLKHTEGLIVGYEWIDISEPGETDLVPPLSVFTAPSSDPLVLESLPRAMPEGVLPDTGVMIVLDWSKPHAMLDELLRWLTWIETWSSDLPKEEQVNGYERLKSIIQHYSEPIKTNSTTGESAATESSTLYSKLTTDIVLPLDPDVLVHNRCGVPIVIVITRADQIDAAGDQMISRGLIASKGYSGRHLADGEEETEEHLKAMSWDERVEWIMQTIRTVALRYGASVIHTTTAKPDTFKLVRSNVLNLLYKIPPPSPDALIDADTPSNKATTRLATKFAHRFPFPFNAKPLDRDNFLIPVGWDTPNKIKFLRDGFSVQKIGTLWDEEVERRTRPGKKNRAGEVMDGEAQSLSDLWNIVVPDATRQETHEKRNHLVTCETEQNFLSRQLEFLMRDPQRDPRKMLRQNLSNHQQSINTPRSSAPIRSQMLNEDGTVPNKPIGVVGPVASGGLAMPNVEQAFASMEGRLPEEDEDDSAEPRTPLPTSSKQPQTPTTNAASTSSNELLNNFFQGLIAGRRTPGSTPKTPDSTGKTQ